MLSVKPWRVEPVVYFCAAVFFCICLGAVASGVLGFARVNGFAKVDDFGNIFLGTFSFQGMVVILGAIFLRMQKIRLRDLFGRSSLPWLRVVKITVITFAIVLPGVWLIQWGCALGLTKLGRPPNDQLAVQLFERADTWWKRAYFGGFAVFLAPVAEEFIFRGLLYPLIKQLGWPRLAWFSVSFFFALIHFDLPTFLPLFTLALALTWLYEKTDCLLAPMILHALFNSANLAMLLLRNVEFPTFGR